MMTDESERYAIRPLGMFRLFLAFLVMLQHLGINLLPPELAMFNIILQPGTIGVVAFLFLSAFIILDVATSSYDGHPVRFIANRALRILPEFLIAMIVAVLVQYYLFRHGNPANTYFYPDFPEAFSPGNILTNLIFLIPLPQGPRWDFVYTIWTVRYEIAFYLAVFVVLAAVNRVPPASRTMLVERTMLSGAGTVVALAMLAPLEGTWKFMATVYSFIAVGAIYYVLRENRTLGKQPEALSYGIVIAALTYLLLGYTNSVLTTSVTLLMVIIAMGLLELRISDRKFARLDHFCGDLSYTVFLLHLQVATLVKNFMGATVTSFIVATVLSFAGSLVVSRLVRRVTGPLRARIRGRAI